MSTTLSIEYGISLSTDCSGDLFEIPVTEVVGGDVVEMRIWSRAISLLEPYDLYKGTESMGAGSYVTTTSDEIVAIVDFAETSSYQAEFPISSITSIEAVTEIVIIDDETGDIVTWATKGENVKGHFTTSGFSCIKELLGTPLYGSVRFTYLRPPYYKLWLWTVPTAAEGQYWFFIYKANVVKNKFSIALPDLTEGPVGTRNITIYVTARDGGAAITNASVYIDEVYYGLTGLDGGIAIDGVAVGTHPIRVSAEGFLDSDLDTLYNDLLQVY